MASLASRLAFRGTPHSLRAANEPCSSFGLISDYVAAAVKRARVVIAEVNERVPFTLGDDVLPAGRIDCVVRVDSAPVEVLPAKIGDTDLAIAKFAAGYIGDGAVLQIGIGAVPDAILRLLHDRRDLGIHSGMVGDGLVDLVEAGVITNACKPIDAGVSITGALVGTERLYAFADRNPKIGMRNSPIHMGSWSSRACRSSSPSIQRLKSTLRVR
jgi:acyl-CoA hydrolase